MSQDTIGRVEGSETIASVHALARLALGLSVTLEKFTRQLEDEDSLAARSIPKRGRPKPGKFDNFFDEPALPFVAEA